MISSYVVGTRQRVAACNEFALYSQSYFTTWKTFNNYLNLSIHSFVRFMV